MTMVLPTAAPFDTCPGRVSGAVFRHGAPRPLVDLDFLFDPADARTSVSGALQAALAPGSSVQTQELSDGTTIAFTVVGAA